jgi:hypothetical protein
VAILVLAEILVILEMQETLEILDQLHQLLGRDQ